MKKVLFLFLFLAGCMVANAQYSLQKGGVSTEALRSGLTFQTGFSYFNRTGIADGSVEVSGVGTSKPYIHIAAAIQIPDIKGVTLTGIQFVQRGGDEVTIFIAEKQKGAHTPWSIVSSKKLTGVASSSSTISTYNFDTPITTEEGKLYAVGYEAVSKEGDTGAFPIGFSFEPEVSNPLANLVTYRQDGATNLVGGKVNLTDISSSALGNALIVALCSHPEQYFAAPYYFRERDLGNKKLIADSLPAKENRVSLSINSMTQEVATSATVEVSKNGVAQPIKKIEVINGIASLELGAVNTFGISNYLITLKKVNGKEVSLTQPTLNTAFYAVTLYDPKHIIVRDNTMVELYTTEFGADGPDGQARLHQAYKQVDFPVIEVVHHTGFYSDSFTIMEDSIFFEKCILPEGASGYVPAFSINRINDKNMKNISSLGGQSQGMLMYPSLEPEEIAKQLKYVKALPAEGKITSITRQQKGEGYSYTVKGFVENDATLKGDLYISMYMIEDSVPSKQQLGAPVEYKHNNLLRKFITPAQGTHVSCKEDGSFEITIDNVEVPTQNANLKSFVIFIHRNPANSVYNDRYIHAAIKMPVAAVQGVCKVEGDAAPIAYALNGHIYIKGMADSFVVYSIGGEQVAASSNEQLPQGIYIVRIQLADSFYTSKVVVR